MRPSPNPPRQKDRRRGKAMSEEEWVEEFSGDKARGYATRRLLFGNPKTPPLPKVRFLRLNRYKYWRSPFPNAVGWELLGPPPGPSWMEKEGLMSPSEIEWHRSPNVIGQVWAYWWSAKQWGLSLPSWPTWFCVSASRNFSRWRGELTLFGWTLWQAPKQPKRPRISRQELRAYLQTRNFD